MKTPQTEVQDAMDLEKALEFFYWTDDGNLCGLRYGRWKIVFQEQRAHGLDVWQDPLVTLRFPKLFCMRTDPYERADHEASDYGYWRVDHAPLCSFPRRDMSLDIWLALRNSRRAKSQAASASIRYSRHIRAHPKTRRAERFDCELAPITSLSARPTNQTSPCRI